MRKIFTILFLLIGIQQFASAQANSISIFPDSIQGCTNTLYIYVSNGAQPENNGVLTVNWGDGTIDTINFTIATANNYFYHVAEHGYLVPGNYTTVTTGYSGTSGAFFSAGSGLVTPIQALSAASCGYMYASIYQTAPSMVNYVNAPLDFIDSNGVVTTIAATSLNNGYYQGLNPLNAPYTVMVNPGWLTLNGLIQTSQNITITSFNPSGMAIPGQSSFTLSCNIPAANPDFAITYQWAFNFVAPLQSGNLQLQICNLACSDTSNASVQVVMPPNFVPTTTNLTNANIAGNMLTFDLQNLNNCTSLNIPFTFPGTTPAGTIFNFVTTVFNTTDPFPSNNSDTIYGTVLNSYDPNFKEVDKYEYIDVNSIETLTYVVHFQNDGNFQAINVVVQDTIDPKLDLATFQLIASEDAVSVNINPTTRVITFTFNNINLQPSGQNLAASQGFFSYSIRELPGLAMQSEIKNTAYIYFDFNPAIVTNTTSNTNSAVGISENEMPLITVYPNPASAEISFIGAIVESIELVDLTGKIVRSYAQVTNNTIHINNIESGVYSLILTTNKGRSTQRLLIQH